MTKIPTVAATVNPTVAKIETSMVSHSFRDGAGRPAPITAVYLRIELSYSACWLQPLKTGVYAAM